MNEPQTPIVLQQGQSVFNTPEEYEKFKSWWQEIITKRLSEKERETNQRIATLEADNAELLARLNQRVADFDATDKARLERIGELEAGLEAILKIAKRWDTLGHQTIIGVCKAALSPSPPAVEKAEPPAVGIVKHKCLRCDIMWSGSIIECPRCERTDKVTLFHPDDAPPEEKPATVPLAVAEALVQELQNIADAKPSTWGDDMRDQFQPWAQNRARTAIAKFKASTQPTDPTL
jgi:hypothetical protein